METSNKHLQDILEIRQIMERSTKFLSLSGWSGIFAGIFALAGSLVAYLHLQTGETLEWDHLWRFAIEGETSTRIFLLVDALIVLILSLSAALFFSHRKAVKIGEKFWSPVLKRLMFSLLVPLITGGLLSLIMMWQNQVVLVFPLTLIFYGIALVNAGRYVNRELVILGLAEILLGLVAALWQDHGLFIWAAGFGLLHIIYGVTLNYKQERI